MLEAARHPVDWERIEVDYRAGVLSLREIAASNGITHGAINKRAKRDGWCRDLAAKIKAKADELVSKQAVSSAVSSAKAVSDRQIIEANAERVAQVRGEHRADIGRSRTLCMALLVELESQTGNMPGLTELGEMLRQPSETGADKLNDIYRAVISLPERSKTMKALAESLRGLVGMEREAYGIDEKKPTEAPGEITITF